MSMNFDVLQTLWLVLHASLVSSLFRISEPAEYAQLNVCQSFDTFLYAAVPSIIGISAVCTFIVNAFMLRMAVW